MPSLPDERSVQMGLLLAIGNFLIFQHFTEPAVNARMADQFDVAGEKSEREALLFAIAFSAIVAGYVKNWHTFVIGAAAIVVADFGMKHSLAINPRTQSMADMSGDAAVHSLPDYSSTAG